MKKKATSDSDIMPEYDFSKGVRGKYAKRYLEGTNLVLLSPDLVQYFPDSDSVNSALRALVDLARLCLRPTSYSLWS